MKIRDRKDMPVDAHGNVADVVMDGNATVNRMNIGRLYEHYFNACSRDLVREFSLYLGIEHGNKFNPYYKQLDAIESTNPEKLDHVWTRLMRYYEIISPIQHSWHVEGHYRKSRKECLETIFKKGIINLYHPTDNAPEPINVVELLEKEFTPLFAPVTITNHRGEKELTEENIRIASLYIVALEKIGDDWSACASAKWQHFGVPAQITSADKYSKPTRNQAVRATGESEFRIYTAYCGGKITADLHDRNNSPFVHRHIVDNILQSDTPTRIERIIDREKFPLGGAKVVQMTNHVLQCAGLEFEYTPPRPINDY